MNPITKISLYQSLDTALGIVALVYRRQGKHSYRRVGNFSVDRVSYIVSMAHTDGDFDVRPFLCGLGWVAERLPRSPGNN